MDNTERSTKPAYSWHPVTGEFVGVTVADESPKEPGTWLYPAYSTDIEPPATAEHEAAVWVSEQWNVVPDWRGHVYWLHDGSRHEITELGVAPPEGALDAPPPPPFEELKARKIAELNDACREYIYQGFESDALGAAHHYPAGDKDQVNLQASVLESLLPGLPENWTTPYWCRDAEGVWALRPHTAQQIQQVGREGKARIIAAIAHCAALEEQVEALTEDDGVEALEAIVWTAPDEE